MEHSFSPYKPASALIIGPLAFMPPIEELSTEDVEALVVFVREQQRIQGFGIYPL
jgi:hypothetical protein